MSTLEAPVAEGPPIGLIVGVIVVIIVVIVLAVMFGGSPSPPPPVAQAPPPPVAQPTPPAGQAPTSSMGRELIGSKAPVMTPDQQLVAKQAQSAERAKVYTGMTQSQIQDQLAQAQRDAGKNVDIRKSK